MLNSQLVRRSAAGVMRNERRLSTHFDGPNRHGRRPEPDNHCPPALRRAVRLQRPSILKYITTPAKPPL